MSENTDRRPLEPGQIFDILRERLGEKIRELVQKGEKGFTEAHIVVEAGAVAEVAELLARDPALSFDYLDCLGAVDYPPDRIAVVYHATSFKTRSFVVVKTFVPRDDPRLPTVLDVWPVANWFEREAFDLLGVEFVGHPDLRRILLPVDWVGYPLRKDYQIPKGYQGIDNTRPPDA